MKIGLRIVLSFVFLAMTASAQAELVGHWTFDEGAGATAFDSSGKGYDGTISGATYTTGKIGSGALWFDGSAHVEVPFNTDLALVNTEYTMAFWVKQDYIGTQDAAQIYIGNNDMNDYVGGYSIYKNTSDANAIAYINTTTASKGESLNYSKPSDGVWTHFAMTFDGTTRTVYLDGTVEASMPSNPIEADNTPSDPLWFGALHGYDWYHLKGAMDDIQIYNQALSVSEIATVAGGGVVPEPSTFAMIIAGLLGLLAFNRRKRAEG